MCEQANQIVSTIIPALIGFAGAFVGGWVAYYGMEKIRRRKSIYDIADVFGIEAGKWVDKPFQIDQKMVDWHNASIDRLSASVNYLRIKHPKVSEKIWPLWTEYHGGDAGEIVTEATYVRRNGSNKDKWILCLYSIADILREN
jgi:hypothetical protein